MKNKTVYLLNISILTVIVLIILLGIKNTIKRLPYIPSASATITNTDMPTTPTPTPVPGNTITLSPTPTLSPSNTAQIVNLDKLKGLDTTAKDWWFGRFKNGNVIYEIPNEMRKQAEKYDGIYRKNDDKKVIYLTFDEGYENGYTESILDTLKEKNVKAIFFVTGSYIKSNPDLIKRMVNEGHLVGNHTNTHPRMAQIKVENFIKELTTVEQLYSKLIGEDKRMYYYRPPEGCYSERDLCIAQQMGYKTVFWSFAYLDYDVNNQKGYAYAYNLLTESLHNGDVLLLHAVSKDNVNVLGDFIDFVKSQGYEIRRIDE